MSLSEEKRSSYASIIDGILKISDLDQVTVKKIRSGLAAAVGHDLTDDKKAIKDLIGERFDRLSAERTSNATAKSEPKPVTNGAATNGASAKPQSKTRSPSPSTSEKRSSDSLSDVIDDEPPKKKAKKLNGNADAALAARLQAEENGRARPTRGGAVRKRTQVVRKTSKNKKSKSANRIKADDDSAISSESGDEKQSKRGGAFNKPWDLSDSLAALTGAKRLSRPQTVKKIWDYIKANNLQFPNDRRQIRCDEAMRAVFNQDKVSMFSLNKTLGKHLYPVEEAE